MLLNVNSTPFQVEFDIPICKVICGDGVAAVLTTEGKVYTWGINKYG